MTNPTDSIDGMMTLLRLLAGLLIFAGFIATIWIWSEFGMVEVSSGRYTNLTTTEVYGPGVGLAIGVGFQSLLTGVLVFVFAHLVESVTRIEHAVTRGALGPSGEPEQSEQGEGVE